MGYSDLRLESAPVAVLEMNLAETAFDAPLHDREAESSTAALAVVGQLRAKEGLAQSHQDSGMLDPRWQDSEYVDRKTGETKISGADVIVVMGKSEPEVEADGRGTSLHDVSGWSEISINTMIVAIHAVAAQVKELRATVSRDDARPEEMKLLEEWVEAGEDLERAYDTVAQTVLNLPPYDRLIHD